MNRPHMILLAVAMTTLALTCSARAYTIDRMYPTSESVFVPAVPEAQILTFHARFRGLVWPYIWHQADWYWDGQLWDSDDGLGGQTAESYCLFPGTEIGTHTIKVRAKYDSFPFGVHVWTDYLTWTLTIVDPETYTIERVSPVEESCTVPLTTSPEFKASFGGPVSQANWYEARWYVDGALKKTEAMSGQADDSFFYPSFTTVGTHEVKVNAKYLLTYPVVTRDLIWTVSVVPHPPTASRVSPGSPVTLQRGGTQAFTARGTDPGSETDTLDIAGVRWYLDGAQQGDFGFGTIHESTIEHAWSHTFGTPGTYQVEAVFYDYEGYSSASGQAVWTVNVETHVPSGSIVSPSSSVTVYQGIPQTFTLRGTDPAGDLRRCEVYLDGAFQTYVDFSGSASGSTAAWTHTFNAPGTYRVAFVPVDAADGYGAEEVWIVLVESALRQAGLNVMVVGLNAQGGATGFLDGARVNLFGPGEPTAATASGQGQFALTGLSPGTYTVNVTKAGYYAQSRSVSLAAGETKDETFRLTPQTPEPAAFDFSSPGGKHFIEGLPGDLSFSAVVAWNGSPGTVRFNVAGTSHTPTVTDLGAGKALASLTVPVPTAMSECSELEIEVANGEGKTAVLNTGVYLYPSLAINPAVRWVQAIIDAADWERPERGKPYNLRFGQSYTLWDSSYKSKVSTQGLLGYEFQLTYDPLAGKLSGLTDGFGQGRLNIETSSVEVLGQARIDLIGDLAITFGESEPTVSRSWKLSFSGKAGVGGPVVDVVGAVFPAALPTIEGLQKNPFTGPLVNGLKWRLYLILGGALEGKYEPGKAAECWFGASSMSGSLTLGLEAQVVFALKKWGWKLEAGVYAGGTGTPEFKVCPTPWEFQGVTFRAYVGIFVYTWSYRFTGEAAMTIRFEPSGKDGPGEVLSITSIPGSYPGGSWEPIGDSALRWGRMNLLADQGSSGGRLHALSVQGETSDEMRLVENVAPIASPALLSGPSERLILFSLHDPNKPWYAATDIGTLHQTDDQPWVLDRITDDQAAEFSPSMVAADSGTTLATWERVSGDISDANDPGQIAPHMEIVAAWFDPATGLWNTPEQLTFNDGADCQPMAIALGETRGILWIATDGAAATGDAASGDRLMFAKWSGGEWNEPQTLWSAQKGIVGFAFAADGFDEGHVVIAVDEDADPNTTADCELYLLSTADGAWQTAIQLTSDSVEDALPTLVTPNGVPICAWSADGTLVYSHLYDWNPRQVYSEYTLANEAPSLDAVTMPGGAAIAYTVQGPNGVDIVASFYDAGLDCWSLPRQLTNDEHAETALSLACDTGELVIAYLKTQTLRTGMDVEIEGQIHHIENVPQPGRTDLYILRHTLNNDLAVVAESLVVEPANPAPGTMATIRATIENRGDLPLQDVEAVFYDGDPSHGGVAIGDQQVISGTLIAGGKQNVSVAWNVPPKEDAHEIFVAVDPSLAVEDRDRSNNELSVRTVLPDLAVETCWSTEVSATTMALTARVVNTGVIPAGAFGVSWRLGAPDGEEIGTSTIQSLIHGGAHEATFLWDTTGHLDAGQQATVFAVVDSTHAIAESDETNNAYSLAVFHPMQ